MYANLTDTRTKYFDLGQLLQGDMFQRKIDEVFKDLPNVFSIVDDILLVGSEADGKDHDDTLHGVLKRCRQVIL